MPDLSPTAEPRRRSDGEATHAAILEAAMRLASVEGLGSLTIGRLARELDISKSGVFAHFRSKQRLQHETIEAAEAVFAREVVEPALAAPEGRARVEALCASYLSYVERGVFPGGCFFAQLLAEFDGPPGEVHDHVVAGQRGWLGMLTELVATAQRHGEIDPGLEAEQLAFELYAHLELANYLATLYLDRSMLDRGRRAVTSTLAASAPPPPQSSPDASARPPVRVRVVLSGRVQGVWYRQSCHDVAVSAGVGGWVRNNADSTVEAVLEGDGDAVDAVVAWMRNGPPRAAVTDVRVTSELPIGEQGFAIR